MSDPPQKDLAALLRILGKIFTSEWVDLFELQKMRNQTEVHAETLLADASRPIQLCAHCRTQIFNRSYMCLECSDSAKVVHYCLDCVADNRRCDHLKSFRMVQIIPIGMCKQLLQRTIQVYNRLVPRGSGEALAGIPSSADDPVSPATIAFNTVELAKEDQRATCHQCKLAKPRHRMAYCTNQASESPRRKPRPCSKKFCASCLWNRYMIRQSECLKKKNWSCPFCTSDCNCSACLRKRGVDPNSYELPFVVPPTVEDGIEETNRAPRPRLRRRHKDDLGGFSEHSHEEGESDPSVVSWTEFTPPSTSAAAAAAARPSAAAAAASDQRVVLVATPLPAPRKPTPRVITASAAAAAAAPASAFAPASVVTASPVESLPPPTAFTDPVLLLPPSAKRPRNEDDAPRYWARLGPYSADFPCRSLTAAEYETVALKDRTDPTSIPLFFFGDKLMFAFLSFPPHFFSPNDFPSFPSLNVKPADVRPMTGPDAGDPPPEVSTNTWARAMREVASGRLS